MEIPLVLKSVRLENGPVYMQTRNRSKAGQLMVLVL